MTAQSGRVNKATFSRGSQFDWGWLTIMAACSVVALALKGALLWSHAFPFNADEAVVGLMAKHILAGERPVFFYGQAYLGSLDAWLVAGAMAALGPRVAAIRVVQSVLFAGTVATTFLLGMKIYRRRWVAAVGALLLAVPPVLVTLYTTVSLGGYGEVLLLGNILLLIALRTGEHAPAETPARYWLGFGLLAGIGFWGFGLLAVYIAPSVAFLIWRELRSPHSRRVTRWAAAAAGFVAGSWPWWQATLLGGANTVAELSGAHVLSDASGLLIRLLNLGVFYPTALIGLRPPWGVTLLALPLAPVALIVFLGTLAHTALRLRAPATVESRAGQLLLLGVCATTLAGLIVTPFGGDPSGRYVLPLAAPLALFTANTLARLRRRSALVAHVGLGSLLVFNLWGNVESARANPPGITTQFDAVAQIDKSYDDALMRFLLDNGETRGYGNYWVGFPLAFLSDEALIFSAQLPYHPDFRYTPRDDRYAPYTTAVAQSERVAYITTHHPALNDEIRAGLRALGVTFEERQIGDYRVFYRLSRAVRPSELGLGEHAVGSLANE